MMPQNTYHSSAINLILMPSWLSGLFAVLAGLIIAGGVILAFTATNSQIQQQIVVWQQSVPIYEPELTKPGQVVTVNDKPTLQGSWPLLIFWSVLGLAVYTVAMYVTRSISDAEAFRESLDYVHANKRSKLEGAAIHIVLRLTIIGLWALFAVMFFRHIVPYGITAAQASAADIISPTGIVYALLSFMAIALSVQLHAVFFRLSVGKVRVFT